MFQNDNIFNNVIQLCDDCNTYPGDCTVNYCDVHYSVTTGIPVSVDEIIPTDIIRNSISTPYGHVHESHISQVKQTSSDNSMSTLQIFQKHPTQYSVLKVCISAL